MQRLLNRLKANQEDRKKLGGVQKKLDWALEHEVRAALSATSTSTEVFGKGLSDSMGPPFPAGETQLTQVNAVCSKER